ncbi:phage tail tape measure protein [Buttiauxella gaviniae]|uniref:phage tail tape measure protein n=1 Tax=Buttiauxella gaviniae TaxID=82990 RepID=UPI0039AF4FFB
MATLRELIIKISANSSSFQSEIARASRMGADYYRTMEQGGRRAAVAARESQRAIQELNEQLVSTKETALEMTGVFAGAFAAGHLIELADNWNAVNARLKQASQSTSEFATVQKSLMDISQRTGTAFDDNANLYSRSAASMREFGYSAQEVLKVTEAVSTGLKLSGASAEESSSVITQFSQALAQGVLRGEEFNAVNESGDRVIRALAAGMGVARKDLKAMADQGLLTIDKVVPALTSQLDKLRGEFSSLPESVSGSVTKVQNAFQQWVGEVNTTSGVTASLSGVLEGVAKNIDSVASGASVLVAVGAAKFFGGMASGAISASAGLVTAYKSEVALTQAQIRGTQISTARARAAVYRAQQAAVAARGTATQEVAERRLAATQAVLTRNINARAAAQERLNSITSVGSRLTSGVLGLVGGIPGLLMLGAGAWYTMYQRQEQARESARAYIETLDEVRRATKTMSLPEADDSRGKIIESLQEQGRLVTEQESKVATLREQIEKLNTTRGQTGLTSENDNNIIKAASILTSQLAVEEEKLNQLRTQSQAIQEALSENERRRNDLIKERAWRQNQEYQSLLMMNGQHTEFNRLLSLGNQLLSTRSTLASAPFRIPSAQLTPKQSDLLQKSAREKELSGLSGVDKVRRQAEYAADDAGLTSSPEFIENRNKYISNTVEAWKTQENLNKSLKDGKKALGEQGKEARSAAQLAENYTRKMDDLSIAIEVQKVRATDGEKASELYAASHQSGSKWTEEQRKAIRANSAELAVWTQRAEENVRKQREQTEALKDLTDAARKYRDDASQTTDTAGMSDRQRSRFDDKQQIERVFDKTDGGTEAIAQRAAALDALDKKYKAISASEADWMSGVSRGYANWFDEISNVSGTVSDGVKTTMDSAFTNVTSMLEGNKVSWKSWGVSVLQMIEKVALQMAVVSAMGGSSSGSGLLGSLVGGVASYFGGSAAGAGAGANAGTAIQNYGSNFQFNAKGGVYASESLSAFSNGIVRNPTMFAFAKGAGVMGEAGPEAIMPLTRAPDGSLGVRSVGGAGAQGGSSAPQVYITIDGNGNNSTQSSPGWEQFGAEIGRFVDQRYKQNLRRDISPGGDIWNATKSR